jgi:hypothetical protein
VSTSKAVAATPCLTEDHVLIGISPKIGFAEPKFSPISGLWLSLKTVCSDLAFLASTLLVLQSFSGNTYKYLKKRTNNG